MDFKKYRLLLKWISSSSFSSLRSSNICWVDLRRVGKNRLLANRWNNSGECSSWLNFYLFNWKISKPKPEQCNLLTMLCSASIACVPINSATKSSIARNIRIRSIAKDMITRRKYSQYNTLLFQNTYLLFMSTSFI